MAADENDQDNVSERGEDENRCPNGSKNSTTPVRKAKGQSKGGQKLFSNGTEAAKMEGTGGGCNLWMALKSKM